MSDAKLPGSRLTAESTVRSGFGATVDSNSGIQAAPKAFIAQNCAPDIEEF
jgi:hypothetical protein